MIADVAATKRRGSACRGVWYRLMATPSPYILAIDQGTTSTRAILFDAAGQARSTAQIELSQHYPQPGWVEHHPEEIWRSLLATRPEAAAPADRPVAPVRTTHP